MHILIVHAVGELGCAPWSMSWWCWTLEQLVSI